MNTFISYFLCAVIALFSVLIFVCFIRALKGPTLADKLVSINMIGTIVIMIIGCLTVVLSEGWLADIAAVYAMISFLAVVVLTKIYIGVYREKEQKAVKKEEKHDGEHS